MFALIAIAAIVVIPVLLLIGDTARLGHKKADPLAGAPHGPRREVPAETKPELPGFVERRSDTQMPFVGADRRQTLASSAHRPIVVPAEVQQEQLDALLASMNAVRSQPLAPHAQAS